MNFTEKLYMYGKLRREDMSLIWKYWEGFIPFTLHWVECGLTSIRKLIKKLFACRDFNLDCFFHMFSLVWIFNHSVDFSCFLHSPFLVLLSFFFGFTLLKSPSKTERNNRRLCHKIESRVRKQTSAASVNEDSQFEFFIISTAEKLSFLVKTSCQSFYIG